MILQDGFFAFIPVSSFRAKPSIFLGRQHSSQMALLVCIFSMAISHSPFFLLPGRSLDFARDDDVGRALSIIHGSQPPALRASPLPKEGGTTLTLLPLEGGAPEGRRLASRMFDYPYSRIVMRGIARNLSCTLAFLPDGSTDLPVFHASSHSPFSLLPGRSLDFARDDAVGRALSIIRGSQPPALRASPSQRKGGTTLTL